MGNTQTHTKCTRTTSTAALKQIDEHINCSKMLTCTHNSFGIIFLFLFFFFSYFKSPIKCVWLCERSSLFTTQSHSKITKKWNAHIYPPCTRIFISEDKIYNKWICRVQTRSRPHIRILHTITCCAWGSRVQMHTVDIWWFDAFTDFRTAKFKLLWLFDESMNANAFTIINNRASIQYKHKNTIQLEYALRIWWECVCVCDAFARARGRANVGVGAAHFMAAFAPDRCRRM